MEENVTNRRELIQRNVVNANGMPKAMIHLGKNGGKQRSSAAWFLNKQGPKGF
ncbi:hypothetical protein [Flagellimonas baculiformis]|uniref:hypothetical protein n=1 Tax=Flagellimonas baculiformis TaxID=3067310 RepID=UPI00296E330D|nr:hypothetical protein [Muricauda sp. D6]